MYSVIYKYMIIVASYLGSCFQSENYPYNDDIPSTAGAGQSSITAETNGEKKLEVTMFITLQVFQNCLLILYKMWKYDSSQDQ